MTHDDLRVLERTSIRQFLERQRARFPGRRVLDFGCGEQPYRELIEQAGGVYYGWDRKALPANRSQADIGDDKALHFEWDVIVNTQTIQYVWPWQLADWLGAFREGLFVKRGVLLMTGPTTWPLVEPDDLCRYTPGGIEKILRGVGFDEVEVGPRASIQAQGIGFMVGWWAVAEVAR